jgi:hypothetical protein
MSSNMPNETRPFAAAMVMRKASQRGIARPASSSKMMLAAPSSSVRDEEEAALDAAAEAIEAAVVFVISDLPRLYALK